MKADFLCVNAGFPPCRHVLTATSFFAYIIFYTQRANLNVAIIAMVNSTYLQLEAADTGVSKNSLSGLSDKHELSVTNNNDGTQADDHDDNVRT